MAEISSGLIFAGLATLLLGSGAYAWSLLGVRLWGPQPLTAEGPGAPPLLDDDSRAAGAGTALGWLAAGFLGLAIALRGISARRPPYGDLFEYLIVLSFGITVAYLVVERRTAERRLGAAVLALAALACGAAEWLLSANIEPLSPALQNDRLLAIHVASMLTAYSALGVAFVASAVIAVQGNSSRFDRLPSAESAGRIEYAAILVGFPILGLGIALGAYWGNIAWGRYWGWDPKETTALASWLVYAGYMHARVVGNWRGQRASMISVLGFGVILFNIFVVNFLLSGLHSYAGA